LKGLNKWLTACYSHNMIAFALTRGLWPTVTAIGNIKH